MTDDIPTGESYRKTAWKPKFLKEEAAEKLKEEAEEKERKKNLKVDEKVPSSSAEKLKVKPFSPWRKETSH